MKNLILLLLLVSFSCKTIQKTSIPAWVPYDESEELATSAKHEAQKMRFKTIQSKVLDKNDLWKNVSSQLSNFSEKDYESLKPLILEQDIPTLQSHISTGKLTYERLTQWYLYRIAKFENDKSQFLNNIIAINPDAVSEARKKDRTKSENNHPLFGIPILIKDNINMEGMVTTAGAHAFLNNKTSDAFIVARIKEKGAIILGKTNLSEWANFLCLDCPNGYSAVGGQTLNPYGRKKFDTGGSSSGTGSAISANYAAAGVGTETSGSILSPSSSSSLAGLKPTTGLLSRGGIVPISSTYDTPGPMTRNMTDNAILLSAMTGEDPADGATKGNPKNKKYLEELKTGSLKEIRFGVIKSFLRDSLYKLSVEKIKLLGGIAIEIDPAQTSNEGFGTVLNADMKIDLPDYIAKYGSNNLSIASVADVLSHNNMDTTVRIPYGHGRLEAVTKATTGTEELFELKKQVKAIGVNYFEKLMTANKLDFVLSIANRSAGLAAAANYPCLTIPMGYRSSGEPVGITFIAKPYEEEKLLKVGYAYEEATKFRKLPEQYK